MTCQDCPMDWTTFNQSSGWPMLMISVLCAVRVCIDGHEVYRDLNYALLLLPFVIASCHSWLIPNIRHVSILWTIVGALVLIVAIIVFLVVVNLLVSDVHKDQNIKKNPVKGLSPYLIPARTSHTRFFPKRHTFSYSYLLAAVPIGEEKEFGSFLSVTTAETPDATKRSTWFSVDASDYLDRGTGHLRLRAKLDTYLTSHGLHIEHYTSVWLVTAPRFLGYSFNPISFWYLYRDDRLEVMILEVNNTFDERRMYILSRGAGDNSVDASDISFEKDKFRGSWTKDFHVSPFNSRKGSYALTAQEPNFHEGPWIDNSIVLKSSKEHVKLIARIHSTSHAICVQDMTFQDRVRFISSWFWVGFLTSPRILREAARLFFERKLHVWYRPEVTVKSVGRHGDEREAIIETTFRDFLYDQTKSKNTSLRYIASGRVQPHEVLWKSTKEAQAAGSKDGDILTLHILTPLFYSQMASASSLTSYLKHNAAGPAEQQTFACSSLDQLTELISPVDAPSHSVPLGFRFLARARALAGRSRTSLPSIAPNTDTPSKRNPSPHQLDTFMLSRPSDYRRTYRKAATALVFGEIISLGGISLLDLMIIVLRATLVFWSENLVLETLRSALGMGAESIYAPSVDFVLDSSSFATGLGCIYLALTIATWLTVRRKRKSEKEERKYMRQWSQ